MSDVPATGGGHSTESPGSVVPMGLTLPCWGCGATISCGDTSCPQCQRVNPGNPEVAQARAARVQWCALTAYVCCFGFALVAWSLARQDLAEIRAGQRHPSARRMTETARDLALWNLGLHGVGGVVLVIGLAIWVWIEFHRPAGQ